MLDSLPPELLEQILAHLPTASSIVNVSRVNRKLHSIISADDYAIFKEFLRHAFPSINTPSLWRDMARSLTSRSRAWDRRSFIARECYPSTNGIEQIGRTGTHQKFGYIPVIDSYDQWPSQSPSSHKQVLAFGAAGRLRLRIKDGKRTEWKSLCIPDDSHPHNDILDLRLLRPHQRRNSQIESVILSRANGELSKVEVGDGEDENDIREVSKYMVTGSNIESLDVSPNTDPILAVCNAESLQLFPTNADSSSIQPMDVLSFEHSFELKHRKRCMKFLDNRTIATGIQFVEGKERAPILIYDIHAAEIVTTSLRPVTSIEFDHDLRGRYSANVLANLDATHSLAGRPGQVFLSGWNDGIGRLHDLRTPSQVVAQYVDPVDDGQILSLSVVGHERFFAGSHQNACLKFFDMRMPGARVYSYLNALPKSNKNSPDVQPKAAAKTVTNTSFAASRDINIFLALTIQRDRLWSPLPRPQGSAMLPRYRGSIYSLSVPSPASSTVFAGIQNHVIQLDFVNTDDILHGSGEFSDVSAPKLAGPPAVDDVLNLSCYERPREGHEATDAVLLRKQVDWHETVRGIDERQFGPAEKGWDHRWRLASSWRAEVRAGRGNSGGRGSGGRWRSGTSRQ